MSEEATVGRREGEMETVPLQPFREAFKRSGLNAAEVALRMGYVRSRRVDQTGDATRLLRLLNLVDSSHTIKKGKRYGGGLKVHDEIRYDLAVRLAEAMDVDPVDVGI